MTWPELIGLDLTKGETAVTLAQRGGAPIEEIRALTQHTTPGVIGVYARHEYAQEKQRVVELIAEEVVAILRDAAAR